MGRNKIGVLFRRVASLSATRHHGVCGLVLTRCLDASPLGVEAGCHDSGTDEQPARGGGTGAMIRGLEDGLDSISALRFAACNTRVRSGATSIHSASGASRSWY